MDHVINSINSFLEIELDILVEEWTSGEYKKLSDCPSYASCKAMKNSVFVLEKYYYGKKRSSTVLEEVKFRTNTW